MLKTPDISSLGQSLASSPDLFNQQHNSGIKSPVKWAGGKSRLVPILLKIVPNDINRYVEPFFGGGALFWALNRKGSLIADSNEELINFYTIIRNEPEELLRSTRSMTISKEEYYRIRSLIPQELDPIQRAARFIYLNKSCFNGLYRVNRQGQFNTPFGGKTDVKLLDARNLRMASKLLQDTEIICGDYKDVLPMLKEGDFVYLDPPYVPIGKYSDFNRYTSQFFTYEDQEALSTVFTGLSRRGIKAILSNSHSERVAALYSAFQQIVVEAPRQINCKPEGRGKVKELIIANFPIECNHAFS